MATHMSMKPYKCPFCDESFRTTVHCKKHMKKHQAVSSAVAAATDTGGGGKLFHFYFYSPYYIRNTDVLVDYMNAITVMVQNSLPAWIMSDVQSC